MKKRGGRHFIGRLRAWKRVWARGRTVQWLRPLMEWVGRYPLLLVFPTLPLLCIWGRFSDMGLPRLFLAEDAQTSFYAGFFTALLLAEACFIGYLLDADEDWAIARRGPKPWGTSPSVTWYFFGTLTYPAGVALLVIPPLREGDYPFLGGVFLAMGIPLVCLLLLADGLRSRYLSQREQWPRLHRFLGMFTRRYPTQVPVLHLLQLGFAALYVISYFGFAAMVLGGNLSWATPAAVICALLGLLAAIYGAVHFFFPLHTPGALIIVGIALLLVTRIGSDEDVYDELPNRVPPAYEDTSLVPREVAGLLPDDQALSAWLKQMREVPPPGPQGPLTESSVRLCTAGPKPRLVLLATSGGGIRAAVWTARALEELDSSIEGFPRYVRLVSGASGGMVGAGLWASSIDATGKVNVPMSLSKAMAEDSLSPVALSMLLPFDDGRGRALEQAWVRHTRGVLDQTFDMLRPGEAAGWRPSLVYSPMIVEDGRRLLVSNLDLSALLTSSAITLGAGTSSATSTALSLSGLQLFQLFPGRQQALRVATAARMSASFPYVSPAGQLPTVPPVRVVDAGYYDNYGVDLLALWIQEHRAWLRECTSGVLLIQIRDQLENGWRTKVGLKKQPTFWARVVAGFTSPPEAVLSARNASMSFRNDELLELLQREFNEADSCFFTTVAFELNQPAPLSWALSSEDEELIEHCARGEDFQRRLIAVRSWLKASPEELELAKQQHRCPGATEAPLPPASLTPE
ncbi:patatin-like phospholipase family protein [Hyalangium versicolor]|uniref:patatin-like phospholipase family protein n=1 Tax=Hyalangium versicolor TaxID=2861190 RepID=UPI001CCDDA1A|nr:patatin-like phospholipase family protein [Hyalangium versicolor]